MHAATGTAGDIGTALWPACHAMAAWLCSQELHDAVVLELGCGVGALGVLCAKLGARQVICTDAEDCPALRCAAATVAANGLAERVCTAGLTWQAEWCADALAAAVDSLGLARGTVVDILASDVLYDLVGMCRGGARARHSSAGTAVARSLRTCPDWSAWFGTIHALAYASGLRVRRVALAYQAREYVPAPACALHAEAPAPTPAPALIRPASQP